MVYSTVDALEIARGLGRRQVVFLSVGFETTTPTVAAALLRAASEKVDNFSVLTANKTIVPALERLGKIKPVGHPDHIIVLGIDGTPEALDWIREGIMDSTSAQPLYDYGIVCSRFIMDYLEGKEIKPGVVEEPGALWSPAEIVRGEYGLELQLSTTLVTKENVDNPGLWGNVLK